MYSQVSERASYAVILQNARRPRRRLSFARNADGMGKEAPTSVRSNGWRGSHICWLTDSNEDDEALKQ